MYQLADHATFSITRRLPALSQGAVMTIVMRDPRKRMLVEDIERGGRQGERVPPARAAVITPEIERQIQAAVRRN